MTRTDATRRSYLGVLDHNGTKLAETIDAEPCVDVECGFVDAAAVAVHADGRTAVVGALLDTQRLGTAVVSSSIPLEDVATDAPLGRQVE